MHSLKDFASTYAFYNKPTRESNPSELFQVNVVVLPGKKPFLQDHCKGFIDCNYLFKISKENQLSCNLLGDSQDSQERSGQGKHFLESRWFFQFDKDE